MNTLRITVWSENVHEHTSAKVKSIYPEGMHAAIADGLRRLLPLADVGTATLQEPDHGLTPERLARDRRPHLVGPQGARPRERRGRRASRRRGCATEWGSSCFTPAHYSKLFKRLMGTPAPSLAGGR